MSPDAFDFEAWRALAEGDPRAYFIEREQTIGAFIAASPRIAVQLRVLQAEIDGLRVIAGSPMRALSGMVGMMTERLDILAIHCRHFLDNFEQLPAAAGGPHELTEFAKLD